LFYEFCSEWITLGEMDVDAETPEKASPTAYTV